MGWKTKLGKHLTQRATQSRLDAVEKAGLRWHLETDDETLGEALELVEFLHESQMTPAQDPARAEALRQRVMEEAARELEKARSRRRAAPALLSPHFLPALSLAAVLVALLVFLSIPAPAPQRGDSSAQTAASGNIVSVNTDFDSSLENSSSMDPPKLYESLNQPPPGTIPARALLPLSAAAKSLSETAAHE